jgi:hypothetical protein
MRSAICKRKRLMFGVEREAVTFGLLFMLCLLMVGCGRSNENVVRIITLSGVTEFFPVFLAQELSYFREEQIGVSLEEVASGSKCGIRAMAIGVPN